MNRKLLAIIGPTATGKTDLGIFLAKKFNGELVVCDSRQVYKGLDIGTGKLPGERIKILKKDGYWDIGEVRVWMYDLVEIKKTYTVSDYVKDATRVIEDILKRGKLPIIVGGTGLYLKALLGELPNIEIPRDLKLREELEKFSLEELQKRLKEVLIEKWNSLNDSDKKNRRRLLRAIELTLMYPYDGKSQNLNVKTQNYNVFKIGLKASREVLYNKINAKASLWIKEGLIEEVKERLEGKVDEVRIKELGFEFSCVDRYLKGEINKDQLLVCLQTKTRQYAKRQITWFKNEKNTNWFDVTEEGWREKVASLVKSWYYLA